MTSTKRGRKVICTTRDEGVNFGTIGVVRDAKSGRKLAETGIKPYRSSGAIISAEALAEQRGWTVVSDQDEDA